MSDLMSNRRGIIPVEKKMAISIGPVGGTGGDSWEDGSNYTGVWQITIYCGWCIDSIQILYDKNGVPVLSEKHGGRGGSCREVKLQFPDEYLVEVSGYYGYMWFHVVVRSLKFKSNFRTYGPFGEERGTPFSLPAAGGKIVGFAGRCDWWLDALGVYTSPT